MPAETKIRRREGTCGWEWRNSNKRATQGEHQEQWVAHLMREDPPALRGEDSTDAEA